ncbi:radical SAM/SPASM domain-containing protein [Musicola keenii]|uniref:radical SAM/SPASM domain-containing protein n=1 Tax=Musicola keenii TaxID=2884250 RepID=UPI001780F58F|nr:radical SAM protein [Musicola keenii]
MSESWILDNENLRTLKHKSGYLVYHRQKGGLCLLNDNALHYLQEYRQEKSPPHDETPNTANRNALFYEFFKRSFVTLANAPAAPCSQTSADMAKNDQLENNQLEKNHVKIVQLVMTNDCNFSCSYCFENRRDPQNERPANHQDTVHILRNDEYHEKRNRVMTPQDAVHYIKTTIDFLKSERQPVLMIQFFGGEPLVNWKAIDAVLTTFGNGQEWGIPIYYSIVTNGSLVNPQIAARLAQYQVAVCVSFDSPTSTDRVFKNGKNARDKIVAGIQLLVQHRNRIAINATLSDSNWDDLNEDMVAFIAGLGIHEIGVVLELDPDFYVRHSAEQITEQLWRLIEAGKKHQVVITGYWHQISQLMVQINNVAQRGFKMCSAKGAQFSIEPNGSIYSCKGASGYFGKISDGLSSVIRSENYRKHAALGLNNPAPCRGCDIEHFCSGICLGTLEKKYHDIDSVEPDACGVYRGITQRILSHYDAQDIPCFYL